MQESIWHYNQIEGRAAPLNNGCGVFIQEERELLARSLFQAFSRMKTHLNYAPMPVYEVAEAIPLKAGVPYERQQLRTRFGYVEGFGQKATSLIAAGATVTYSDIDGDGIDDTATISVTTTAAASEIKLFFQTADGAPGAGNELWEIVPTEVTKSGNTATIVTHRANCVKPSAIWLKPYLLSANVNMTEKNAGDTETVGDFITAVDVYRVYLDSTTPAYILSDNWVLGDTNTDQFNNQAAGVQLVDSVNGIFRIRNTAGACPQAPERLLIYYKAGYPLTFEHIEDTLGEAVIRLANALHPYEVPCEICDRTLSLWVRDRDTLKQNQLRPGDINSPYGLLEGEIFAWRVVCDYMLGAGGKVT